MLVQAVGSSGYVCDRQDWGNYCLLAVFFFFSVRNISAAGGHCLCSLGVEFWVWLDQELYNPYLYHGSSSW